MEDILARFVVDEVLLGGKSVRIVRRCWRSTGKLTE